MDKNLIIPALADITWNPEMHFPRELLLQWESSDRSAETHRRILSHHLVTGTVVCSDSSGFTKLTRESHVLRVAWLVHRPKAIIYAYGKQLGGIPLGIWDADNTCMFYPADVPLVDIIRQMAAAQLQINADGGLKVSIGILSGEFIRAGNFFWGDDFDIVNTITEDLLAAGDLTALRCTEKIPGISAAEQDWQIFPQFDFRSLRIRYGAGERTNSIAPDHYYPKAFSDSFLQMLLGIDFFKDDLDRLCEKLMQQTHACFLKIYPAADELFLDRRVKTVLLEALLIEVAAAYPLDIVQGSGDILVFCPTLDPLLDFIRAYCGILLRRGIQCSGGIAYGMILRDEAGKKGAGFFEGNAVNIASKLAEDIGARSIVHIHETAAGTLTGRGDAVVFEKKVSGVVLKGIEMRLD